MKQIKIKTKLTAAVCRALFLLFFSEGDPFLGSGHPFLERKKAIVGSQPF